MPIDLTHFERGDAPSGDYPASLVALQRRLSQVQIAQIVHRRRALIVLEGWTGSGKQATLKRLVAAWDPCHLSTHCVTARPAREDDRHWLAPFWSALPPGGGSTIFNGSWYRRLIEDQSSGLADPKRWSRACDEINEFEAQQRDHGTLIVKLFLHVTAEQQQSRLRERQADPWRRHLIGAEPVPSSEARERTIATLHAMFAATDTRWAPWCVIDANDRHASRIAALTALADAFERAMPSEPPVSKDASDDRVIAFPSQKSA